jgi:uncharacterized protein YndB with AHSA1/START domain
MPSTPSSDRYELVSERQFSIEIDRVWEQCTSKRGLESWWSPEDLRTTVKRLEARPGGAVEMSVRYVPAMLDPKQEVAFRAAGIPISFTLRGTVREMERNRHVTFELTLTLDRAGAGITTVTRLEFEPFEAGTKVKLIVTGKSDPHMATLGQANLEGQLDRLGRSLDS